MLTVCCREFLCPSHTLLFSVPRRCAVPPIGRERCRWGRTPIRSVGSSTPKTTATAVAPYPPRAEEVGSAHAGIVSLDGAAGAVGLGVERFLFHFHFSLSRRNRRNKIREIRSC